jgi:hypothetical protein
MDILLPAVCGFVPDDTPDELWAGDVRRSKAAPYCCNYRRPILDISRTFAICTSSHDTKFALVKVRVEVALVSSLQLYRTVRYAESAVAVDALRLF